MKIVHISRTDWHVQSRHYSFLSYATTFLFDMPFWLFRHHSHHWQMTFYSTKSPYAQRKARISLHWKSFRSTMQTIFLLFSINSLCNGNVLFYVFQLRQTTNYVHCEFAPDRRTKQQKPLFNQLKIRSSVFASSAALRPSTCADVNCILNRLHRAHSIWSLRLAKWFGIGHNFMLSTWHLRHE